VLILPHQSFNEIVEKYQKQRGKTLEVIRKSRSDLEETAKQNPGDFFSAILLAWDLGQGVVGTPEQIDNGLFPEWKPKKVLEVLP
jgi:hypothetical protein